MGIFWGKISSSFNNKVSNMNDLELKKRFCLCFEMHELPQIISFNLIPFREEDFYIECKINEEALKKIMYKNDLEQYTNMLLQYTFIDILYIGNNINKNEIINVKNKNYWREKDNHEIAITESLIFLITNEKLGNSPITFKTTKEPFTVKNIEIIKLIKKTAIKELILDFNNNNYNIDRLNHDEAENEIRNKNDIHAVSGLIHETLYLNERYSNYENKRFSNLRIPKLIDNENDFEIEPFIEKLDVDSYIDEEMISWYSKRHFIKREVTLDFLKKKLIKLLNKKNSKQTGAKQKNQVIQSFANKLCTLSRLDSFLKNNDGISDINNYPIKNRDLRFAHDCLVLFNLIESKANKANSTTPEKYVYMLLKQAKEDDSLKKLREESYKMINNLKIQLNNKS